MPIISGEVGAGGSLSRSVTLTDAQIKTLPTTSVEIIPAQGVGTTIVVFAALFDLNTQAGAYTGGAPTSLLALALQDANGNAAQSDWLPTPGAFTIAARTREIAMGGSEIGSGDVAGVLITHSAPDTNSSIVLVLSGFGANFGGGNAANSLRVTVWYDVI